MKISVITINLNNGSGLEATINSVLAQEYADLEYIVIDGNSIDGSKDLIKKNLDKIHCWVSEQDKGIYAAMNKGLAMATGNYVLFLNSGDTFFNNNVLQKLVDLGDEASIIYGNLMVSDGRSNIERTFPSKLSFSYFLKASLPHPATLIKRKLFDITGFFFEELKIVADWAFFMLAITKYNCSYKYVPVVVAKFDLTGISSQEKNLTLIETERAYVLSKYFPLFLDDYAKLDATTRDLAAAQKQMGFRVYNKWRKLYLKNLKSDRL